MPTPRPTIDPITVAQLGMSTTYATRDREPAPTARPSSAVPIGRPIATRDPKASSRITIATSRPSASPTPAGASSNAKYRSPPASIRSDVVVAELVEERLEVLQVARRQVLCDRGTGPGSARPCRRARPFPTRRRPADRRAGRRPGRSVPSTFGSAATASWTRATSDRARTSRRRSLLVARREHDVGAEPHRRGVRLAQQLGGSLRVQPGRLERVLELAPEGGRGGDDEEAERDPGPDHDQGWPAAKRPSRSSARDMVTPR